MLLQFASLNYYILCQLLHTVRKAHTKLHPGPEWHIVHILAGEDTDAVISRFKQLKMASERLSMP